MLPNTFNKEKRPKSSLVKSKGHWLEFRKLGPDIAFDVYKLCDAVEMPVILNFFICKIQEMD